MAQQTFISRTSPSKSIAPVLTEQYVPFFALPVEIRMMIYVQILRPDCKLASKGGEVYCDENHNHLDRGLDTTAILSACSQTYFEAIELLHRHDIKLEINGKRKKLLRGPLDFGKPGYMRSTAGVSRCFIPAEFDELQIIRMRRIEVDINFAGGEHGRVFSQMQELARALTKNHALQEFKVFFVHSENLIAGLRAEEFAPAVRALFKAPTECWVQVDILCDWCEACIGYKALELVLNRAHNDTDWKFSFTPVSTDKAESATSSDRQDDEEDKKSVRGRDDHEDEASGRSPDMEPKAIPSAVEKVLPNYHFRAPESVYSLVPECRTCYAIFSTDEELRDHLSEKRSHRRQFTRKTFNNLNRRAYWGNSDHRRKCWSCGKPFNSEEVWLKHMKKYHGRWRHGIVPRYQEDNARWNARWRWHKSKYGWL